MGEESVRKAGRRVRDSTSLIVRSPTRTCNTTIVCMQTLVQTQPSSPMDVSVSVSPYEPKLVVYVGFCVMSLNIPLYFHLLLSFCGGCGLHELCYPKGKELVSGVCSSSGDLGYMRWQECSFALSASVPFLEHLNPTSEVTEVTTDTQSLRAPGTPLHATEIYQ